MLVQSGRGTARGKLKSNGELLERLQSKCSTFIAYAPQKGRFAFFLGLEILGVKPSLSIKNPNPATVNPNLLWRNKTHKFLKSQSFLQGKKNTIDGILIEVELVNTLDTSLALKVFIHWAFNLFSQRFEQIEFVN